jgi:hypothetical protein
MLTIYISHVKCDDIMLNHHLQLDVAYATSLMQVMEF